jgi:hypothetical protein
MYLSTRNDLGILGLSGVWEVGFGQIMWKVG